MFYEGVCDEEESGIEKLFSRTELEKLREAQ